MCGGKDVTGAEAGEMFHFNTPKFIRFPTLFSFSVFLADCLSYDFSLGVWTPFAPMEEARWDAESLFIGDELAVS